MNATFTAKYHGECGACGGDLKDKEATYDGFDTIVHVKCPETPLDVPKGVPLCHICFTYHNGECL